MNTYMVEVNNHFLVRIEIEGSALAAEHYFLDGFKCVWGANAYDEKGMKTDCFRGAVLQDELITLNLLEDHLHKVDASEQSVKELEQKLSSLEDEIKRLSKCHSELLEEIAAEKSYYMKKYERCNCKHI